MLEYVLILLPFMKNFQDSQQMFIWCSENFEPFLCKFGNICAEHHWSMAEIPSDIPKNVTRLQHEHM